ncbi:integrase catalytic domain-containing protein [Trichonephila clavipes]|nr:integrase catalytic domain-containing protein [Trichonephila clavipes]
MKIITVNNYEDFSSDFPVSQDILPPLTEKDFNLSGLDNKIKNRLFQLLISHKSAFARSTVELSAAATELFVKQKEKWRLVLDFRKLNEITVTQDFVIPTLDDILHEISGSNYFSALDMKSAFNQIPLHFADRHKTAFSTPDGRKFKVFTDHKPLAGFLSNKNPSSKILRWKLALEEFNYDIHYIRGSLNSVADHLSRYINNITIALPDSKDLINMQREDSVLSTIIQKIDQNDVSPQISNYFINGEGLLCHLSKRPSRSPRSNTTRKQVCIPHCLKAKILESVHSEYGGHLKFFKTYHRLSESFFWRNMYKDTKNFVRSCIICLSRKNAFKIPPAPHQLVEQSTEPGETCHMDISGPLKPRLKDQEASHVELSTRATKQHHYDYKIGSLCFIKTPNIKSNLSPKLRPKFEGPYRVIERFSNVNYRVQHVEQLRKRFNTHVNRMIPFIKRFSYLHLKNLDDLQPDETEVKGIVPSPRYNLRARAEEEFLGVSLTPPKRVTHFPRLEEGNVPINTSWYGMFLGISRVLGESWTARRYHSADSRPIRKADCVSKKNPLQNTEVNRREI